ncbi:MAG: [Fe-Fe] hydrogenase large subunit C-terminal domain-containing protein [Bacillota bacterium]
MQILTTLKTNCKNCYKCIRQCPVKAIEFSNYQAQIIDEECVLCGMCYNACPQDAKSLKSDIEFVKTWLMQDEEVIVSIAPSFLSDFYKSDFDSMKRGFLELGFTDVFQTAESATIIKNAYEETLTTLDQKVLISSCCPTVNLLIQKHYPTLIPFLAKTPTPMVYHGHMLKKQYKDAKVVFVGPCIAKKYEQETNKDYVDAVLSFEDIKQWFDEASCQYKKDNGKSKAIGRTNSFPTAGGIIKSFTQFEDTIHYLAVDGMESCIDALNDIQDGVIDNCFIEMSACKGSCVGGPLRNRKQNTPVKSLININTHITETDYHVEPTSLSEVTPVFDNLAKHHPAIQDYEIESILNQMGKTTDSDHLNCGSCGYKTCYDKAVAIARGKADLTMCLPYLKDKAESFSDHIVEHSPNGVLILNEKLEVHVMNTACCKLFDLKSHTVVLSQHVSALKDPSIYYELKEQQKKRAHKRYYIAEVERYVDESIVYDDTFKIYICILRDITKEVKQQQAKKETQRHAMKITDDVILKQMRVVHEIASLLGETTAETKVALTKLKGVITDE